MPLVGDHFYVNKEVSQKVWVLRRILVSTGETFN